MSRIEKITLDIDDMSCGHCVHAVTNALKSVRGVAVEDVQLGKATVEADLDVTTPEAIAQAVQDAGYATRLAQA